MHKDVLFELLTYPVFVFFISLELIISAYEGYKLYSFKDTATNLLCSALNAVFDLATKGLALAMFIYLGRFAPFHISNPYIYWTLLFLGEDFLFWFLHWVDHNVRFFWAIHVTHHSSENYNFTVAIRSSVFQPLYRNFYFIPLALAGFNALDILLMFAICNTYGFFIHTKLVKKLGFIDSFMATPSNHRVHHASNIRYLDMNMVMVLVIWDRLFGTYTREEEEPVFGLTQNLHSYNIGTVILHEWKKMLHDIKQPISFKDKLMYIFGPPGWSHDGSTKTAKQLRAELAMQETNSEMLAT